jgi:ankyrin repeat protein
MKKSKVEGLEFNARMEELITYLDNGGINLCDKTGKNILMIASASKHSLLYMGGKLKYVDVMKKSLEKGIDINKFNRQDGKTALFYAVQSKLIENINFLLKNGADVKALDHNGNTVSFDATDTTFKQYEVIVNHVDNLNHQNNYGNSALMYAVTNFNSTNIIHDLLDRGANPKLTNQKGQNAYEIANFNRKRCYLYSSDSANEGRFDEHNHRIDEVVRRLHCMVNDKKYKPKKFRRKSREHYGE